MRDMLFLSKWFTGLEEAPDEVLKEIGFRMIKELIMNKEKGDHSNDPWEFKKAWLDIEKEAIATYNEYNKKREYGEQHGKKMDPKSVLVWKYCQTHKGAKGPEVGAYLKSQGYDIVSQAKKGPYSKIYDLPGWKNRDNPSWLKELEISDEFVSKFDQNSEKTVENSTEKTSEVSEFSNFIDNF